MPIQPTKPMNKNDVSRSIAAYETTLKEGDAISAAFKDRVLDCWDVTKLSTPEMCALHEAQAKNRSGTSSLILVNLKKQ